MILDVDGVLTDGRVYLGPDGGEWKAFHVHDGLAVARAVAAGLTVAVVSSRASESVAWRCAELGVREVHQGVRDKLVAYAALCRRHGCGDPQVLCVGDDLADLPILLRAGLSAAPADAAMEVRRRVRWVSRRPGGAGAVREILEVVLRAQGLWATGGRPRAASRDDS